MEQDAVAHADAVLPATDPPAPAPPEPEPTRDGVGAEIEALLAGVTDLPLRDQVEVYQAVHDALTGRLNERDA